MIALFRSGARTALPRQQHSRTARRSRLLVSATTAGILIGTPFAGGTAAAAARAPAETASVVADWNAIAVSTLARRHHEAAAGRLPLPGVRARRRLRRGGRRTGTLSAVPVRGAGPARHVGDGRRRGRRARDS